MGSEVLAAAMMGGIFGGVVGGFVAAVFHEVIFDPGRWQDGE